MSTLDMTAQTRTTDSPALRRVTALLIAGTLTTVLAVLAGLGLLVIDPSPGSTTEAAFGLTAAVYGLLTAALFIAAAVYAQARNLWGYAPTWLRLTVLGLVIVAVIRSIVASFS